MPKQALSPDGWTYYPRYVRCQERCAGCRDGKGHGPYYYRQQRVGKKLHTEYIGKQLPAGFALCSL